MGVRRKVGTAVLLAGQLASIGCLGVHKTVASRGGWQTEAGDDLMQQNWNSLDIAPCGKRAVFFQHGHMQLGVKFITSNPVIADAFKKALDSWEEIVDLDWRQVDKSRSCSMAVIDGNPNILMKTLGARAQFPEWERFTGHIAVDPDADLTADQWWEVAFHEVGHMLGLKHNPERNSIMCSPWPWRQKILTEGRCGCIGLQTPASSPDA
jgi:hypothetical protein